MLYELIYKAQEKNDDAMMELIDKFTPLFKKYARKLNYEDAYEDIILYFIKMIKTFDLSKMKNAREEAFISYINITIINFYNKNVCKAIREKKEIAISTLTEEQRYYVESLMAKDDVSNVILELGVKNNLSEKEYQIVHLIYFEGYSVAEVARLSNKTRQSVNQFKQRILKKMKETLI